MLSRTTCDSRCIYAQYTIYPDGRVEYDNGLNYKIQARMPLQSYRALAAELVRTPAFRAPKDYRDAPARQPATSVWVDFVGGHASVAFPTQILAESPNPAIRDLNKWARLAAMEAGGAVFAERRGVISRRRHFGDLRRVVFDSNGCFGTCPAYRAEFYSDGSARLLNVLFFPRETERKPSNATAHVPFSKVMDLLKASAFAGLDPQYPFRVEDVYGVSFEFEYRGGYSFTVQAPDRTQWPPEVAQLAGAFQQLVRDTEWTTPIAASSRELTQEAGSVR